MYDDAAYKSLVEISRVYSDSLKDMNIRALTLMQNDSFTRAMSAIQEYAKLTVSNLGPALLNFSDLARRAMPEINGIESTVFQAMQAIAQEYKQLFSTYDFTALSDSLKYALEQTQFITLGQLCMSHKTTMIHDLIGCMANVAYEKIPSVINTAMLQPIMGGADVAFIRTGTIIPILGSELKYPRGFKNTVAKLNITTADDISDSGDIQYDTKAHVFIANSESPGETRAEIGVRGLNVVCAGLEVFDGDMFTETELIDFVSKLSQTPMAGFLFDTGKKIHQWLTDIHDKKENDSGFDKPLYYHSRLRNKDLMPFTFDQMLKAPYGVSGAGRFNPVGRGHFYFASTQKGAENEVVKHKKKEEVIQTVKLRPTKTIVMLDLSGSLHRGNTFLRMIRFPLSDANNKMPAEYLLPCFVADCCRLLGYDGIKYYGSKEYDNYVTWSDGYFEDAGMC